MSPCWHEVSRLFDGAVGLPPSERDAFLDRISEADLRREVASLLDHDARSAGFLEEPAWATGVGLLLDDAHLAAGAVVGNYRIVRRLGAGGMGSVFLAERSDDRFDQRVALKVVHAELASPELRRLFHRERQILAALEHPAIARLIDGGELDDGRPYLVMELVEGLALDQHCKTHGLPLADRLELFAQVCDVVQVAHSRRIVHCDLKPGNILVDTEGRLRLVDFGTAGLLPEVTAADGGDTDTPGPLFATPKYQSPELREGGAVGTPVDVYSLGVVLERLAAGDSVRDLPTDLQAIVAKACAEDPAGRYSTVVELGSDVRSFLAHRPVAARPRGPVGRAGLLARRHPWASLTAVATLALALLFVAALRSERDRATRALDRAELAGDFLIDLFAVADPGATAGAPLTASDLLDRGAAMLEHGSLDPPLRLRIVNGLARRHLELGQISEAHALLETVAPLLDRWDSESAAEAFETAGLVGEVSLRSGDWGNAVTHFEQALDRAQGLPGISARTRVRVLSGLAETRVRRGESAQAAATLAEARRWAEDDLDEQDPELGRLAAISGFFWHQVGRLDEAETAHRRALDLALRRGGAHQPAVADALGDLALIYQQRGDRTAAYRSGLQALEIQQKIFAPGHPALTLGRHNLGSLALAKGAFHDARRLLSQAHEDEATLAAASPMAPIRSRRFLAYAHYFLGDFGQAERDARQAIHDAEALGLSEEDQVAGLLALARILDADDRWPEAEGTFHSAIERSRRSPEASPARTRLYAQYVLSLLHRDRLDEARLYHLELTDPQRPGPVRLPILGLAEARLALAEQRLDEAAARLQALAPGPYQDPENPWFVEWELERSRLFQARQDGAQARSSAERAQAIALALGGERSPLATRARQRLAALSPRP